MRLDRLPACLVMLATLAGAALVAPGAHAEPCPLADRECGKRTFEIGTAAFDRGAYAEALTAFEDARAAEDHPFVSFNVALCLERLGKLKESKRELDKLLQNASLASDLRKRVSSEHGQVAARLAHVSLETPSSSYVIEIDGERSSGGAELELDPGEHHLRVTMREQVVFDQTVKLEPSERLRLGVTDRARAIDVVVVPERAPPSPAPPVSHEFKAARKLSPVVFYATASVSLVLGGLTLWSGLDVKSAYRDYQHDRPQLTPAEAERRVDDGHARERRTNVLLGATALTATAAAAIGIFWVDFGQKGRVALGVSGQSVRLSGTF